MPRQRSFPPLTDRGPLNVMFLITSMPVGGAETLLVNLVRGLNRRAFLPELCCLKELGPLGEELAREMPTFHGLTRGKYDLRVLPRLTRLFRDRRIDAVVTVGAGDKMFWGRLAARRAGVPVILSALHSTGWPDGVGRLNRLLTPITDGFIGVAKEHGRYLVEQEGFPAHKVHVIPNGVDTRWFCGEVNAPALRGVLKVTEGAPLAGIVAALRPEKNHALFLEVARLVREREPRAEFLIVGDGPERSALEAIASEKGVASAVHFLGTRSDIPQILSTLDVFVLTSRIEANPVSILEAMAAGKPVVAPDVGSIAESVVNGVTGFLTPAGDARATADRIIELFRHPDRGRLMGAAGREAVAQRWSLARMIEGYERLIAGIYGAKSAVSSSVASREEPRPTEVAESATK